MQNTKNIKSYLDKEEQNWKISIIWLQDSFLNYGKQECGIGIKMDKLISGTEHRA